MFTGKRLGKTLILVITLLAVVMLGTVYGAKPVEIIFTEQDDPNLFDPTWQAVIHDFEAQNPDIMVKLSHKENEGQRTDWLNSVLAGSGPDLISCPHDNIGVFGASKTAMELDKFFSKQFFAQFSPKDINDYKFNGKIYGIPYKIGNCLMLIYNKKLMKEPPQTMDELIAKAAPLTKAPDQYGLVFNEVEPFFFIPFLGGYNGHVFDAKGKLTLNTAAMGKMVQLIYDLKYKHQIIPKEANYDVAAGLFKEGKAAMIINGPWFLSDLDKAGIDYGITRLPKLSGGTWPAPFTGAKVFMINPNIAKDTAKKAAVRKLVGFLNSAPIQLRLAKASSEAPTNLVSLKDPYVTNDPKIKALADQMQVGTPMPTVPEMRAVWDTMRTVVSDVMGGRLKPEDAPKKMQADCENLIKSSFGK